MTQISQDKFTPFEIIKIERISPRVFLLRFKLNENEGLNILPLSSIIIQIPPENEKDEPTLRYYTPTTSKNVKGYFELVIKEYSAGMMTKYISKLKVGDLVQIKGPYLIHEYTPNSKKEIGMIAGGTGFTPMLQVINVILNNKDDKTVIKMLFANKTSKDIPLKDYFDNLEDNNKKQFNISYIVDSSDSSWKGETGYITKDIIKKYMPSPKLQNEGFIYIVGPPKMIEIISGPKMSFTEQGPLSGFLKELGYKAENVFKF
ncbi:hypothetical protein BB558_003612 [Smittium angustum]|uniref:cytochrome-b5 reductase n=1 Tax=Smittium angustum TaxID=133377 RepID=A0A2U1J5M6_SMIAN|nr:hypothetical protein BB558_003612 [Smittium angustum]